MEFPAHCSAGYLDQQQPNLLQNVINSIAALRESVESKFNDIETAVNTLKAQIVKEDVVSVSDQCVAATFTEEASRRGSRRTINRKRRRERVKLKASISRHQMLKLRHIHEMSTQASFDAVRDAGSAPALEVPCRANPLHASLEDDGQEGGIFNWPQTNFYSLDCVYALEHRFDELVACVDYLWHMNLHGTTCCDFLATSDTLGGAFSSTKLAQQCSAVRRIQRIWRGFSCRSHLSRQSKNAHGFIHKSDWRVLPKSGWDKIYGKFSRQAQRFLAAPGHPTHVASGGQEDEVDSEGSAERDFSFGGGSDIDEGFCELSPCMPECWYVKLVPDRFSWNPESGVGETEWNELVQNAAIQARRKSSIFECEHFPMKAARRLLAIVAVQNLKSYWIDSGFGSLFAQRFAHPELVSKAIAAIANVVCDDFISKRSQFIERGLVNELM